MPDGNSCGEQILVTGLSSSLCLSSFHLGFTRYGIRQLLCTRIKRFSIKKQEKIAILKNPHKRFECRLPAEDSQESAFGGCLILVKNLKTQLPDPQRLGTP